MQGEENFNDELLSGQIPEYQEVEYPEAAAPIPQEEVMPRNTASAYVGQKLSHNVGRNPIDKEANNQMVEKHHLSRVGEKIGKNAELREGWINVPRDLFGERSKFYPESWEFKIKPATVEATRNWSTIDEENPLSVDEVFDEILKTCLAINTPEGPKPWYMLNSWDRFFVILLIREYTFQKGEAKIEYTEECGNCEADVVFTLNSQALLYDMPDPEVMPYFNAEDGTWVIDPSEYDVDEEPVTLYLPTLGKSANIKAWWVDRLQNNKNVDKVFLRFLPWIAPKISKDLTVASRQIKEYEAKFKSWDIDMFSFMNSVLTNINVTPIQKLKTTCPVCGEEVTSPIRFQDGIGTLFDMAGRHKKFGKK